MRRFKAIQLAHRRGGSLVAAPSNRGGMDANTRVLALLIILSLFCAGVVAFFSDWPVDGLFGSAQSSCCCCRIAPSGRLVPFSRKRSPACFAQLL